MRVHKIVVNKEKLNFLNIFQYTLSVVILFLFLFGLVPFSYYLVFYFLSILIIVQLIISLLRFRLLNILIELLILGLAILSLIPLLGYGFRFLAIFFLIFEFFSFKNNSIYYQSNIRVGISNKSKKASKKKENKNVKDASFSEK